MRTIALCSALSLAACSAEDLEAFESNREPLVELSHTVDARLHEGIVILRVTDQLRNDGPIGTELTRTIDLPAGGVVTAFHTSASRDAELLELADAEARWEALLSPGDAAPATSASMRWVQPGQVELRVFGLGAGEVLTVSYDVQVPPRYEQGQWRVDGLTFPRGDIDRVDAKWALLPLGPGRTLWRLELDAAQLFQSAPVRPNVVFAIDASHSQGEAGIKAQLELIGPYLAHVPDAQVELIVYRRFAERVFNRFLPVSEVAAMIAGLPKERLAPGNGSNLDLAAQLAASTAATRVVLMTDEALRDGFDGSTVAFPSTTVVHVLARSFSGTGGLQLQRDDESPLAALAKGGIFARVDGTPDGDPEALLGLVRPLTLDHFSVEAPGLGELDTPGTLEQGDSLRFAAIAEAPPAEITVRGQLWSVPQTFHVKIDPALSRWLPGIAIGDYQLEYQLNDDEVLAVARLARAVSPMTSYLAVPAQAGASTIGLTSQTIGLGMIGTGGCGCGGYSSSGCSGIRVAGVKPDYAAALAELFAGAFASCGPGVLRLEATADEIVDVAVESGDAACLTEAAWAIRLTPVFTHHETYVVSSR